MFNVPYLFALVILCSIVHFFLGIAIFSGLNVARLFSPVICAFVYVVRKLVNCCCCRYIRREWRMKINQMLDEVVRVEEDRVADVEEGEGGQMLEQRP